MKKDETTTMIEDEQEGLRFNLKKKEIPVTLIDPETEKDQEYMLRELDGEFRDEYLNKVGSKMRINERTGAILGLKNFKGIQSGLVMKCLVKVTDDGEEEVDEKTIQSWPSSVVTQLYNKARELSGLDESAEDDAKND